MFGLWVSILVHEKAICNLCNSHRNQEHLEIHITTNKTNKYLAIASVTENMKQRKNVHCVSIENSKFDQKLLAILEVHVSFCFGKGDTCITKKTPWKQKYRYKILTYIVIGLFMVIIGFFPRKNNNV